VKMENTLVQVKIGSITNFHQNNDLFIIKEAALWPWAPAEALRAREVA
jgi:hypothetical protein